jgi:ubiquinone/menaquinone biosynthesis C-methylase UbiE
MSDTKHTQESTFRSYGKDESKRYAQLRLAYHPSVYESVIAQHTANGGKLDSLLDIGCGPGLATRDLAAYFKHATGIDPGESMIEVAQSMDLKTSTSESVVFKLTSAEEMAGIENNSIDVITAANAAHWFDMPAFWKRAAQVLKPGGCVAMWTSGELVAHSDTPNADKINEAFKRWQNDHLEAYYETGNFLVRNQYKDLPMPWDATPPVQQFDRASLFTRYWAPGEQFHAGGDKTFSLDLFEKMFATSSPVTRWRKAHPEAQGTEEDVVRRIRNEIERLLREAGVPEGEDVLKGASPGALVMVVKRPAE